MDTTTNTTPAPDEDRTPPSVSDGAVAASTAADSAAGSAPRGEGRVDGGGRTADNAVRALARAVDRNARKTTELNEQVRRLGGDVARLAALVTTPPPTPAPAVPVAGPGVGVGEPAHPAGGDPTDPPGEPGDAGAAGGGEPPAVRSWLLASDPELAVADLADLVEWLDRVYLRYPLAELGGCWLWHPHVIEELWWLRRAHADAYDPEHGSWLRVGDWHDRQRPGVTRRVREVLGKCDLSLHAPGRQHGHAPAVAPLVAHAARIATEWATTSTRPEPTAEQLNEAGDYAQAMHRRTR